jgi:hypothetical protein
MKNFPRRMKWAAAIVLAMPPYVIATEKPANPDIGQGSAVIRTPKRHILQDGGCRLYKDGTYMGEWTSKDGAKLMFAIGPATWEFVRFVSKKSEPEKYHGPATYKDVWMTFSSADVNLGWIDTVTVNPDGKTGSLDQSGNKIANWNCGLIQKR